MLRYAQMSAGDLQGNARQCLQCLSGTLTIKIFKFDNNGTTIAVLRRSPAVPALSHFVWMFQDVLYN